MDGSQILIYAITLIVLLGLSACFSSTETAYSSSNSIRLKQMAKNGNKKAKIAYNITKKFTSAIATILIGNNIVNILATSLATSLFTALYGDLGVAVATIVMTVLVLVFGEILPKVLAKSNAEAVSLFMAKPLSILMFIFKPITSLVVFFEDLYEEKAGVEESVTATEDELLEIVSTIEQEGVLEQEERELIESVIEFDDTTVKDVMVPREKVVFLYDNATFEQLKKVLKVHKLSRFPIVSYESLEVVGIINIRDVFDCILNGQEVVIQNLMRKPIYVSQRRKLPQVLETIQKSREHMAVVVESVNSRNFVGILTLEDVLEEIVGEIYDEHDVLPNHILEIGHHTFVVDGNVPLFEFFDDYVEDQEMPNTKSRTIGAWITELNGGRKVRKNREIEFENFEIKVLETKDGIATKAEICISSYVDDEVN